MIDWIDYLVPLLGKGSSQESQSESTSSRTWPSLLWRSSLDKGALIVALLLFVVPERMERIILAWVGLDVLDGWEDFILVLCSICICMNWMEILNVSKQIVRMEKEWKEKREETNDLVFFPPVFCVRKIGQAERLSQTSWKCLKQRVTDKLRWHTWYVLLLKPLSLKRTFSKTHFLDLRLSEASELRRLPAASSKIYWLLPKRARDRR
jgi:hypothetical protein